MLKWNARAFNGTHIALDRPHLRVARSRITLKPRLTSWKFCKEIIIHCQIKTWPSKALPVPYILHYPIVGTSLQGESKVFVKNEKLVA